MQENKLSFFWQMPNNELKSRDFKGRLLFSNFYYLTLIPEKLLHPLSTQWLKLLVLKSCARAKQSNNQYDDTDLNLHSHLCWWSPGLARKLHIYIGWHCEGCMNQWHLMHWYCSYLWNIGLFSTNIIWKYRPCNWIIFTCRKGMQWTKQIIQCPAVILMGQDTEMRCNQHAIQWPAVILIGQGTGMRCTQQAIQCPAVILMGKVLTWGTPSR